jgi:hypothetical protein
MSRDHFLQTTARCIGPIRSYGFISGVPYWDGATIARQRSPRSVMSVEVASGEGLDLPVRQKVGLGLT